MASRLCKIIWAGISSATLKPTMQLHLDRFALGCRGPKNSLAIIAALVCWMSSA